MQIERKNNHIITNYYKQIGLYDEMVLQFVIITFFR